MRRWGDHAGAYREAWQTQYEAEFFYLLEYTDAHITERFRALMDERRSTQ